MTDIIKAAVPIATDIIGGLVSSIFKNAVIGDQVKGYAVKSLANFKAIVANVQQLIPSPANDSEAEASINYIEQSLLPEALAKKQTDTNATYVQLFKQVRDALQAYINTGVYAGVPSDPGGGNVLSGIIDGIAKKPSDHPPYDEPATSNNLWLWVGIGVAILIIIILVMAKSGKK